MAIESYSTQLERVQETIAAIEQRGQSYGMQDGRSLTRADLATLYARERELRRLVAKETRGGARVRQVAP